MERGPAALGLDPPAVLRAPAGPARRPSPPVPARHPESPRRAADSVPKRWPRTSLLAGTLGPDLRVRPARQRSRHGLGDHRDDDLRDGRLGRGRVAARPLAGHAVLHPGRHHPRHGGGDLPGGRQVRRRRPATGRAAHRTNRAGGGAGHGRRDRRRRDNGDPQRPRARHVLAAGQGFKPPASTSSTRAAVLVLAAAASTSRSPGSRSSCGRHAAMLALLVAAVRKPQIVPGKLQFLGESGYSLVRDGIARDVIGPKGLPFAPFLARAVLLHPGEQRDEHRAVLPDLADVEVRLPAGPRGDLLGALQLGRHPRAGRRQVLQGHPRSCPASRWACTSS